MGFLFPSFSRRLSIHTHTRRGFELRNLFAQVSRISTPTFFSVFLFIRSLLGLCVCVQHALLAYHIAKFHRIPFCNSSDNNVNPATSRIAFKHTFHHLNAWEMKANITFNAFESEFQKECRSERIIHGAVSPKCLFLKLAFISHSSISDQTIKRH